MAPLPRLAQPNAMKASTMAEIIWGMFSMMVGMALIRPPTSVTMTLKPVSSSFGALSLMMPAMLLTISGTCSTRVGMLSANPCARFIMSSMPESTSVPAPSRSEPVRPSSISRPFSITMGMLSSMPCPMLSTTSAAASAIFGMASSA